MIGTFGLTLGDVVREHRRTYPRGVAVVDGDVRLTWPALDDRVNRLANALAGVGFGRGDRLLWLGQNSFRLLEALLAVAKLGGMVCPANWRQSPDELAFVIGDLDPRVVIWQRAEIGDRVDAARSASAPGDRLWLQHDGKGPDAYESFVAASAADCDVAVDPDLPVLVVYTAAFAGKPNGSLLTHTNLLAQSLVMALVQDVDDQYVFLNSGPLFHLGTLMVTIPVLHLGGTNVFVRRVDARELCEVIERERCTGAFIVEPTMSQILELNADGRYDLSSLRVPPYRPEWVAMCAPDMSPRGRHPSGFGQTELTGLATFNAFGAPSAGRHGRASPLAMVRVADPSGNELAVGEVGELWVRGPIVHAGYWNRPELNARRQRDGWWRTNDLGRRETDGSITFVGPADRMIKSGVENIYPAEVEACIEAHPAVAEAAVIGVPHEQWVQTVKALVVVAPGAALTERDVVDHCRSHIASYKKPTAIEFVPGPLPRVGPGKDYDRLDAVYGGGGYPGESIMYMAPGA
jgi:acyl-CoA synthetase (AMP-forming)/AMP-acid ligase II